MRRIIMLWLRIESVFTFLYRKEMKQIDDCWRTFTDSRLKVNYYLYLLYYYLYLLFTWKHTLMYSDFIQGSTRCAFDYVSLWIFVSNAVMNKIHSQLIVNFEITNQATLENITQKTLTQV